MERVEIKNLPNGRKYRLTHSGEPYKNGEYPSGGIKICAWDDRINNGSWIYIDNTPDEETLSNFLKAVSRNK